MSINPYDSPQHTSYKSPYQQPPSQLPLVLGIISIVSGVLTIFPGCCCGVLALPGALISIGTGIGGLMTAEPENQGAKITSIIGIVIGTLALSVCIIAIVLTVLGHTLEPNQF